MSDQFRHLLSPLQIGSVAVRNRSMISGHNMNFGRDNMISERHAYYYAERARGGVGLITTEIQGVHPTGSGGLRFVCMGYDRASIPRYRLVADMVHEHGAKIFAQIWHSGMQAHGGGFDDWTRVWAPSAIADPSRREVPKAMEVENIKEIAESFARTAANVQEAGFDGVEVHGGHGYLIHQFLSPLSNRRTDDYGGSLDNRMRFCYEVIDAVRRECGRDFVMGLRISGDDFMEGGLDQEDVKVIAKRLADTGKIDFLHVSAGISRTIYMAIPGMHFPLGNLVYLAAGIKQVVDNIPIFTVARIKDPVQAEQILASGHADMVAMTRAHICDPEIINKTQEGRLDDIRPCISCNQGCLERFFNQLPGTCIQNVAAGREKYLGMGTMHPAASRKRVMVIGGGPAGLEAARVAALRGHEVTLYEKASELGGQVNIAAKGPGRQEMGDVARWLGAQVKKLGVQVRLGEEMTAERVVAAEPDAVVVATGSTPDKSGFTPLRPHLAGIEGAGQENVVTVWDVLSGTAQIGQNVIVVDEDGYHKTASVAEYLADAGKQVEVLSRLALPFPNLAATLDFPTLFPRLLNKGVIVTTAMGIRRIQGERVIAFNIYTGQDRVIDGVDTVVLAMGDIAHAGLYQALKGKVKELHAVGDCAAPRKIANAIWEGHQAGRAL